MVCGVWLFGVIGWWFCVLLVLGWCGGGSVGGWGGGWVGGGRFEGVWVNPLLGPKIVKYVTNIT